MTISDADAGKRIDLYICASSGISRSRVQKLIESGDITVNGERISKNYKLKKNDDILIFIPEPNEPDIQPENIELDIIYEDDDIIVINKPQNMVVHPAAGHLKGTVVNALMYHCRGSLSGINGVLRPGIVHRIDKDTSGIIVAAKNDESHNSLAEQFACHSITRIYYAVTAGHLKETEGTIDKPIGRCENDRKKMAVTDKNSKRAVTHYRVIQRLRGYDLIECRLETGRTHQIRVHLSYMGHPLLGDMVYGYKKQPFPLKGQALHAKVLGFRHPSTGKYIEFDSELPEYFKTLIEKLI